MPDVNILVYAHREETREHARYAQWLTELVTGPAPFALSEMVLQGFLRIVGNGRIFAPPSSTSQAFGFLEALLEQPGCCLIRLGATHWGIFRRLCEDGNLRGKHIADAAHAALALESGCEWVSADTDFARFAPKLRWRHL